MTTHDDTQRWPLPDGWRWMQLGETISTYKNINPEKHPDDTFYYIDIGSINSQKNIIEDFKTFTGKEAPSRARRVVQQGDVLFSTVRPYLKNISIAEAQHSNFLTSTGIAVLRANRELLEPKYLFYQVISDEFIRQISGSMDGTLYPAIRDSDLEAMPIPVPPLDTQRQLVTTIERLFARVARAREALSAAPDLLEQLRQSVLAAAFRGDLTRAWREANPDAEPADALLDRIRDARRARFIDDYAAKKLDKLRAKSPISPADEPTLLAAARREAEKKYTPPAPLSPDDLTDLPELPQGWCWAKLDEVFAEVKNGVSIKPEGDTGERILRISAVRPLKIDYEDTRYLSNVEGLEDYKISYGDLLYTRYNGSIELVGVCSLVREDVKNIFYPDKLIRCRCAIPHIAPWVELATSSMYIRAIIERMAKSTSGQTGISGADLKSLAIPLPSADELPHIVAQVSLAWSKLSISAQVADMTAQLDQLEQSILSKAFRGELGGIEAAVERVEAVASAATQGSLFDL